MISVGTRNSSFIRMGKRRAYPPVSHHLAQRCPPRYLLIPRFLSTEDTDALLKRAQRLLEEFSLDDHPLVSSFKESALVQVRMTFLRPTVRLSSRLGTIIM